MKAEPARPLNRATSAAAVEPAGTGPHLTCVMVNTNMTHEFKHPNYYKELRKRNREVLRSGRGLAVNQAPHVSDQAISRGDSTEAGRRAPGPGLKPKGTSYLSDKRPSAQAQIDKHPNPEPKAQASSQSQQALEFDDQGTSAQALCPGHKQRG